MVRKMNAIDSSSVLLVLWAASVVAACATTAGAPDSTATIGTVLEKHEASATAVSGTYAGGIHSPLHSLVSNLAAEPAHTVYVVQGANGGKRYVRERASFEIGACVAVMTAKERSDQEAWKLGEAVLRPSNACGP